MIAVAVVLLTLFVSCQSTSGQTQYLSNKATRKKMMNTIAGDSTMSKYMIGAMMNSKKWNDGVAGASGDDRRLWFNDAYAEG